MKKIHCLSLLLMLLMTITSITAQNFNLFVAEYDFRVVVSPSGAGTYGMNGFFLDSDGLGFTVNDVKIDTTYFSDSSGKIFLVKSKSGSSPLQLGVDPVEHSNSPTTGIGQLYNGTKNFSFSLETGATTGKLRSTNERVNRVLIDSLLSIGIDTNFWEKTATGIQHNNIYSLDDAIMTINSENAGLPAIILHNQTGSASSGLFLDATYPDGADEILTEYTVRQWPNGTNLAFEYAKLRNGGLDESRTLMQIFGSNGQIQINGTLFANETNLSNYMASKLGIGSGTIDTPYDLEVAGDSVLLGNYHFDIAQSISGKQGQFFGLDTDNKIKLLPLPSSSSNPFLSNDDLTQSGNTAEFRLLDNNTDLMTALTFLEGNGISFTDDLGRLRIDADDTFLDSRTFTISGNIAEFQLQDNNSSNMAAITFLEGDGIEFEEDLNRMKISSLFQDQSEGIVPKKDTISFNNPTVASRISKEGVGNVNAPFIEFGSHDTGTNTQGDISFTTPVADLGVNANSGSINFSTGGVRSGQTGTGGDFFVEVGNSSDRVSGGMIRLASSNSTEIYLQDFGTQSGASTNSKFAVRLTDVIIPSESDATPLLIERFSNTQGKFTIADSEVFIEDLTEDTLTTKFAVLDGSNQLKFQNYKERVVLQNRFFPNDGLTQTDEISDHYWLVPHRETPENWLLKSLNVRMEKEGNTTVTLEILEEASTVIYSKVMGIANFGFHEEILTDIVLDPDLEYAFKISNVTGGNFQNLVATIEIIEE